MSDDSNDRTGRHRPSEADDAVAVEAGRQYAHTLHDEVREAARRAEAVPTEAEKLAARAVIRERRRIAWFVFLSQTIVLIAVGVVAVLAFYGNQETAAQQAELSSTGVVADARSARTIASRAEFTNANRALIAAGLTPVPDPGPTASPDQLYVASAEARGTLRALAELQKRGAVIAGVRVPDPTGAGFPRVGR